MSAPYTTATIGDVLVIEGVVEVKLGVGPFEHDPLAGPERLTFTVAGALHLARAIEAAVADQVSGS